MTELRISSRQQGSMRRRRQRNLRISSRKHNTLLGKEIKIRSQTTIRSQKSHAIRPCGVERNENDVGFRGGAGRRLLGFRSSGGTEARRQQQNQKKPPDNQHMRIQKV